MKLILAFAAGFGCGFLAARYACDVATLMDEYETFCEELDY